MERYNQDSRTTVNCILRRYNGSVENRPLELPSSGRLVPLFVRLEAESYHSFHPLPDPLFALSSIATEADLLERQHYQVEKYLGLKPEDMTAEWREFGRRNRDQILIIRTLAGNWAS